ncbi:MAG TPA: OsmC family protein [Actinomycetota bacterium]|nr:OsmC family protein [Actinomycetota bacterium]
MTPVGTIPVWTAPSAREEPRRLAPGEAGRIVVAIDVPEGCHIQSHTPAEPFLIPTTLALDPSAGLSFGPASYPAGETERFDWTPVVLDVYRGRIEIVVPVTVEAGAILGRRTVPGRVRYQGCTATACLPPAELGVSVDLEIVEQGGGEDMQTTTVRNGVDVERLVATIGAIGEDPNIARFTFKARTQWQDGASSRAEIHGLDHMGQATSHATVHALAGDEPDVLLGTDSGPNAVELALAALGFCYSVGFAYNAAARGFDLEELTFELEGDLDLRNFVGIAEGPRPGFTEIRVKTRAKAKNASAEELEELCRYVQETSPVRDILANPVPVTTSIEVL